MRSNLVLFALAFAACGTNTVGNPHGDGGGPADLTINFNDDGPMQTTCDDQHPCGTGHVCYNGICIPDNGMCTDDDQCENDTYCDCTAGGGGDMGPCMGGICVPYGDGPRGLFDPGCMGGGFAATDFKNPTVKCHWTNKAGDSNVIVTPLVVDLDKDGKPEIVFATYPTAHLIAIHGKDCTDFWANNNVTLKTFTQLAAGDLDGDGFPEIVGVGNSGVIVFDHNGQQLATGTASAGTCSGPAIADVDNVAPPEIVVDGTVLRYTKGQNTLTTLFTKPSTAATWGNISVFADMDGDGKPEVVTGLQVYDGTTGADKTPANLKAITGTGAYPAIADFNGDKKPDIVLVQSASGQQKVTVFDFANNKVIFGPYTVQGGGWGGPPTVGDYDGDGVPDFGLASTDHYYVYAMKCGKQNPPPDCKGPDPGVLWEKPTHDSSSGGTASSTFDFNGDGINEVVYRDECWLRVYNGPNGKAVFAQTITSGTCLEYPVIADVDGDMHADLVVPSDNVQQNFSSCPMGPEADTGTPWGGYTTGIFVLQDPMNRWMPSRPMWTAHSYHITEINDNLSVPAKEKPNWLTYNNYRVNVQGMAGGGKPQADLTGGQAGTVDNGGLDCKVAERLWAAICNRGDAPVAPGVPGTFYTSDPRQMGAMAICTATTTMTLNPGDCEQVYCDWMNPPQKAMDLWFRSDDNGNSHPVSSECKNGNDLLFLPQVVCNGIG